MATTKFVLMFLLCSELLLTGCGHKKQEASNPKNEYDERVSNILSLSVLNTYLSRDSCMTVYLLQTTTCSVCSKTGLENIRKIEKSKGGKIIFLLAGHKEDIESFLKAEFDRKQIVLLYDDAKEMPSLGLNFFRDMAIQICDKKVVRWNFVDS